MGDSDEEQADENPEEASQKQAWIEMRKWMSENSSLLEPDNVDESQSLFTNSKFLKVGKRTIKKIESFVDISMSESKDFVIRETSNQRRSIFEDIVKAKAAAKMKVNTNSVGNGGGNGGPGSNSSINNTSLVAIKSCSEGFGLLDSESNTTSSDKQAGQSSKIMTQPLFGSEGMWTKVKRWAYTISFFARNLLSLSHSFMILTLVYNRHITRLFCFNFLDSIIFQEGVVPHSWRNDASQAGRRGEACGCCF